MRHNYIGTEHLLLGLIRGEGGVAGRVLREFGLKPNEFRKSSGRLTGTGQYRVGGRAGSVARHAAGIGICGGKSAPHGHHYIGAEHCCLGLVRYGEGVALDVLRKLGVTPEQIRRQLGAYCRRARHLAARARVQPSHVSHARSSRNPKHPWSIS